MERGEEKNVFTLKSEYSVECMFNLNALLSCTINIITPFYSDFYDTWNYWNIFFFLFWLQHETNVDSIPSMRIKEIVFIQTFHIWNNHMCSRILIWCWWYSWDSLPIGAIWQTDKTFLCAVISMQTNIDRCQSESW